ncbi:MAG TPA: hypothetical protein DCR55_10490 [Lentisphaeria bacterium]|nr:hypothetical protein [Lentisphaeria bacterium]
MAFALILSLSVHAEYTARPETERELLDLCLEELMDLKVTTVSKRSTPFSDRPAAGFVLTRAELIRFSVSQITDALRLVPSVQVARLDSKKWAIMARGGGTLLANNLLVMIDGRSVCNKIFSGVLWHNPDLQFEDIERIEVVRGPVSSSCRPTL